MRARISLLESLPSTPDMAAFSSRPLLRAIPEVTAPWIRNLLDDITTPSANMAAFSESWLNVPCDALDKKNYSRYMAMWYFDHPPMDNTELSPPPTPPSGEEYYSPPHGKKASNPSTPPGKYYSPPHGKKASNPSSPPTGGSPQGKGRGKASASNPSSPPGGKDRNPFGELGEEVPCP